MILRPATAADAPALAALHAAGFETPWTAAAITAALTGAGAFGLQAGESARPDGFVLARVMAGEAEILTLAVAPDRRRAGVGRALVRAAAVRARTLGAEALFLEVAVDNPAATRLYESEGFVRAGVRRGYYRRTEAPAADALVLRLPLAPA